MSNAVIHAENSAKRWGGEPDDYLHIHVWLDSCKAHIGDNRHRVILHNAWGIELATKIFGHCIWVADEKRVFIKDICEQHVLEDLGFIPTLHEALQSMEIQPWMAGAVKAVKEARMLDQLKADAADAHVTEDTERKAIEQHGTPAQKKAWGIPLSPEEEEAARLELLPYADDE